jgi:hypothetical protein
VEAETTVLNAIFISRFSSGKYIKDIFGGGPLEQKNRSSALLSGGRSLDFLAEHFTIFGFTFQWWMPIIGGGCAIYIAWLWWTGQFWK